MNFWKKLPKPIIGLSPMDGVTDSSFRHILSRYEKPDVVYTEFVNVMGLCLGKLEVYRHLIFEPNQRPIVAQVFGAEPDYFYKAAHIICELGFDGVDINMGCPAKNVVNKGGGANLITIPKLTQEIVAKTKQGIKDWAAGQSLADIDLEKQKIEYVKKCRDALQCVSTKKQPIPISIKTRLGFDKNIIDKWSDVLIETKPDAICVHGRTFKQMYLGHADWQAIGSVSDKIKEAGIIYLGNGDIKSTDEAKQKCQQYNLDGILVGRATLGNPWFFQNKIPTTSEKLQVLLEHIKYHQQTRPQTHFHQLKKHMVWYCKGFDGAKDLRIKLMKCKNYKEVVEILNGFLT
jgi:nifR3 family TIM-barrel protein